MKKKKKNKYTEFGRSMIEILGMLAIVGVISIGSVMGLRYAFDKHQSNEIISELAQQAILISSMKEHNQDQVAELDELKNSAFAKKYDMSYNYTEQEGFFSITLNNVPEEVVQELIAMKWNLPYNIYINGIQIYDYNVQSKKEKHSHVLTSAFVKSALAGNNLNTIKFVFQNKLDETIKPDYIDKDTCLATGGRWEETRCFCPTGAIMAVTGCITQCGGDTGIECPTEPICFRDSECRGCSEICQNGVCVLDKDDKCNGKPYCEGDTITSCVRTGSKSTACAIHYGKKIDCSEKGNGMTCSMDSGVAECVQGPLDCGEHGQWEEATQSCLCDEGFLGTYCEEQEGFSPCQTYTVQDGKEVRGFKPEGTPCDHAGIEGECNRYGRCVPTGGTKCKGINACEEGYFCNYGGHVGDYQGGGTPDICEVVSAKTFKHNGKLYYYNTATDLRAWCRPADKGKNCTWGFLSYYGAQSWCKSLDAELVEASVIHDNCDVFSVLPSVVGDQQYWVKGQSVVHMGNRCSVQKMSRTDGYAAAAGVLCVTDAEEEEYDELTAEEEDFIKEMRQVKQKLENLDSLRDKYEKVEMEKKRYELKFRELDQSLGYLNAQIKSQVAGIDLSQQQKKVAEIQSEIASFRNKYNILLHLESQYDKMMPIFERVYEIANRTVQAADNLTLRNIKAIRQYKQEYDSNNYPQKLFDAMGLGNLLTVQPSRKTSFNVTPGILNKLLGIKSANAGVGSTTVYVCSAGSLAVYDMAVGAVGTGLDTAIGLFGVDTDVCSTVGSYLQVGADADRIIDMCGLEDVNHIDEKVMAALGSGVTAACQGGCKDDQTFVLGYGCCTKGEEDYCSCVADKGEYINGKCCKQSKALWADSVEKCKCEAAGDIWISEGDGVCCPQGSDWNKETKKCDCPSDDKKCNCKNQKGTWDDSLGCCQAEPSGHWDNGVCCPKDTHNSDGICCEFSKHNSDGICCEYGEHNSDGHCCNASFEWNGESCGCPDGTEKVDGPYGSHCCETGNEGCKCIHTGKKWYFNEKVCCDPTDEKCNCRSSLGEDWDDTLGCCRGHWDNGLCCRLQQHNSNGHCCGENEEWSVNDTAWYDITSLDSGSCCPKGRAWNGKECSCPNGQEKDDAGNCCQEVTTDANGKKVCAPLTTLPATTIPFTTPGSTYTTIRSVSAPQSFHSTYSWTTTTGQRSGTGTPIGSQQTARTVPPVSGVSRTPESPNVSAIRSVTTTPVSGEARTSGSPSRTRTVSSIPVTPSSTTGKRSETGTPGIDSRQTTGLPATARTSVPESVVTTAPSTSPKKVCIDVICALGNTSFCWDEGNTAQQNQAINNARNYMKSQSESGNPCQSNNTGVSGILYTPRYASTSARRETTILPSSETRVSTNFSKESQLTTTPSFTAGTDVLRPGTSYGTAVPARTSIETRSPVISRTIFSSSGPYSSPMPTSILSSETIIRSEATTSFESPFISTLDLAQTAPISTLVRTEPLRQETSIKRSTVTTGSTPITTAPLTTRQHHSCADSNGNPIKPEVFCKNNNVWEMCPEPNQFGIQAGSSVETCGKYKECVSDPEPHCEPKPSECDPDSDMSECLDSHTVQKCVLRDGRGYIDEHSCDYGCENGECKRIDRKNCRCSGRAELTCDENGTQKVYSCPSQCISDNPRLVKDAGSFCI